MKKLAVFFMAALLLFAGVPAQPTQATSNAPPATVNLTAAESVTLSVTGGPVVINPTTGVGTTLTTLTSWTLNTGHTSATLYSWFSSATAAISAGTGTSAVNIPSSQFSTTMNSN